MIDSKLAGTGNSRFLKSVTNFLELYPSYEDFVSALVAGTLPIDLNGINPDGWTQQGTPLNTANLLSDSTANLLNVQDNATVDGALKAIATSRGQAGGIATLDSTGKVPTQQLPSMNYIPTTQKGASGGVATLDQNKKVPISQLPSDINVLDSSYVNVSVAISNIDIFEYKIKTYAKYGPFLLLALNMCFQQSGNVPDRSSVFISNLGYNLKPDLCWLSLRYGAFSDTLTVDDYPFNGVNHYGVYVKRYNTTTLQCDFDYDVSTASSKKFYACGATILAVVDD